MDLNELENRLKNSSQRQEEQVDTNALWSVVQKEIGEEKKRRPLFIWLMFGVMTMIGSIMLYTVNDTADIRDSIEGAMAQENIIIANATPLDLPISIDKESDPAVSIERNTSVQVNSSSLSIANEIKRHSEEINSKIIEIVTGSLSEKPDGEIEKPDQTRKLENAFNSQKKKKSSFTNYSAFAEPTYEQELRDDSLKEKEDSDISNPNLAGSKYKSNGAMKFVDQPYFSGAHNVLMGQNKLIKPEIVLNTPMVYSSIQPLDADLYAHLSMIAPIERSPFFSAGENGSWSIGLIAGVSFNSAVLFPTNDDIRDVSFATRSESLSTLASWNASLLIGRRISDYLWIQSGLEVNSILNKSSKTLMFQQELLKDDVVVEQVIGPNGTTDIIGQATVIQETTSLRTRISKNYELSVPLMLQVELPSGALRPFFALGVDYSFLLGRSGLIHLNSSEEYNVGGNQESLLDTNLGLSARVQVGLKSKLTESLHLMTIIGYRKSFYSHFRRESGISEKYNSLKFQLGIEHQF